MIQQLKSEPLSEWEIDVRLNKSARPLFEVGEGVVYLNLHSGQMQAWDSTARIVAMIAGSQGGKTSFAPWWLYREIKARGAGDYIAATASYDLFKLKLLPELRNVFEHTLKVARYWSGDKILELINPNTGHFDANRADDPMWGRIILRSAVSSGGLESTTAKAAVLDEAGQDNFDVEAWDAVQRRLTLHKGRILIPTTPYNMGWLKQQVVDRAGIDNAIELIQFESVDNPAFPRDEFERLRATMPSWKFNMFMRGLYTRPPGMIYTDFKDEYRERNGHKVKPFDIPRHWPRFVGVDPGVIHTCKVWLAHDEENDALYIYREQLGDRKPATEHAAEAVTLAQANHELISRWAVGSKSEVYHREDWIAAGAWGVVEPSITDVEGGIDRVISRLKTGRLFVFDTCTGTLDQFGTYARELDKNGEPTDKIKNKATYHYLDAVRYAVLSADSITVDVGYVARSEYNTFRGAM